MGLLRRVWDAVRGLELLPTGVPKADDDDDDDELASFIVKELHLSRPIVVILILMVSQSCD